MTTKELTSSSTFRTSRTAETGWSEGGYECNSKMMVARPWLQIYPHVSLAYLLLMCHSVLLLEFS